MAVTFREPSSFWKETLVVTGCAAVAGVVLPPLLPLSLAVSAPAAALLGGSIGAAITRQKPKSGFLRAALGAAGGALAALGHVALATKFGLDVAGAVVGGALGGLAVGGLLTGDDEELRPTITGAAGATALGAIGVLGATSIARYGAAEGSSELLTGGVIAGLMGLWIAAGAGLRRLEAVKDPIEVRFKTVAEALVDPVLKRATEGMNAYREIKRALDSDDAMGEVEVREARGHAEALTNAMLDTAEGWARLRRESGTTSLEDIEEKLKDLNLRTHASDDPITIGHLTRAAQALRAQKASLESFRVGRSRSEAALDAQVALLDRLRLCIVQHQATDRERFTVELDAVADQVARLTDDLDSLSAAIAEAEAFSDKRLLADVERAGRRAMDLSVSDLFETDEDAESEVEESVVEEAEVSR